MNNSGISLIDTAIEQAWANAKSKPTDYVGDDGFLYCGICHARKRRRIELYGHSGIVPCLCDCENREWYANKEKAKHKEDMIDIDQMRSAGFPDSELKNYTFDRDDRSNENLTAIAKNYVNAFNEMLEKNEGLLLYGNTGTGKTFMACCIANALIDMGRPCLVTNFARLINTISGMREGKQEYIDSLNKYQLLVVDDLGAERDTEYAGEVVQNIIDGRCRSGRPIIITTNLTAEDLRHPSDVRKERIYSRLFEMCIPYEVKGVDRRKAKLRDSYSGRSTLLGMKRG